MGGQLLVEWRPNKPRRVGGALWTARQYEGSEERIGGFTTAEEAWSSIRSARASSPGGRVGSYVMMLLAISRCQGV